MPFARAIVASRPSAMSPGKDAIVNTLYFNISSLGPDPGADWNDLCSDLYDTWAIRQWAVGSYLDVRLYDMADAEPRAPKARRTGNVEGTRPAGVPQVALALSYYADRNLPRQRGRIFLGPWSTGSERPTIQQQNGALSLCSGLADLGGVNVDWSLWSPTTQTHTRISNAWVDNSWDIIRSRKIVGTSRVTWSGDG
jgi:hypothetical protein